LQLDQRRSIATILRNLDAPSHYTLLNYTLEVIVQAVPLFSYASHPLFQIIIFKDICFIIVAY